MKTKLSKKYFPANIEKKWQERWEEEGIYKFALSQERETYYNLVELPYPSGDLHLGHWFAFVPPDVHARFMKMSGRQVFYPNGFDAFGLPAENAAIKRDIHPRDWTLSNIEAMKKQFGTMGTMIDWSHEVVTCEPEYYRWNQWIFLKFFERGLAYRGKTLSNWCPSCQTVLANEAIESGKCWRCGSVVEQKEIEQWFLKITDYADKLLWENTSGKTSNGVNWPKSVREGQNNWIGKSEGALIRFKIDDLGLKNEVSVFTTRPDTLYGATFMVVAPEHPLLAALASGKLKAESEKLGEVRDYIDSAKNKTELERKEQKQKTGVFTGLYAIHPLTSEKLPIWVADYVLWGYGTGAIMAVPGHDERDNEFAKKYDLPIKDVIRPASERGDRGVYSGYGEVFDSGNWNGLKTPQDMGKIIEDLRQKGIGEKRTTYHLHDWSVSRQRYWGTPVPMIHCDSCGIVPVPEKDLPVELPYEVDYTPKGKPPLATAENWLNVKCPKCGSDAKRDAETLDTFFDSAWYYYRYVNPSFENGPFDEEKVAKVMPIDVYSGGSEHTLGHTLYARFFTKFFQDLGLIEFSEFAHKRIQHGIILGPDGNRMSKSKGNVVNPDDLVREYGADTVRIYLSFIMPYEDTVAPWNPKAIAGVYRFLTRIWQLQSKAESGERKAESAKDLHMMHKTIKNVGEDLREFKFNTAVAFLMEWINYLTSKESVSEAEYRNLILMLAPFAPHMTEELYQTLPSEKRKAKSEKFDSVHLQSWPEYDEKYLVEDELVIAVQVNGKLRGQVKAGKDATEAEVEKIARSDGNIQRYLAEKEVIKLIYIQGKILNFVVG